MRTTKPVTPIIASIAALALIALTSISQADVKSSYDFPHYQSYEEGMKAGKAGNKLVLLDFYFDT